MMGGAGGWHVQHSAMRKQSCRRPQIGAVHRMMQRRPPALYIFRVHIRAARQQDRQRMRRARTSRLLQRRGTRVIAVIDRQHC